MSEGKVFLTDSEEIGGNILIFTKEDATLEDLQKTVEVIEQMEKQKEES